MSVRRDVRAVLLAAPPALLLGALGLAACGRSASLALAPDAATAGGGGAGSGGGRGSLAGQTGSGDAGTSSAGGGGGALVGTGGAEAGADADSDASDGPGGTSAGGGADGVAVGGSDGAARDGATNPVCTLVGCSDGAEVTLNMDPLKFPTGTHQLIVISDVVAGSCSFAFPTVPDARPGNLKCVGAIDLSFVLAPKCVWQGGGTACITPPTGEQILILGAPTRLRMLQIATADHGGFPFGGLLFDEAVVPAYSSVQPNGPGCEPTCQIGQSTFTVTAPISLRDNKAVARIDETPSTNSPAIQVTVNDDGSATRILEPGGVTFTFPPGSTAVVAFLVDLSQIGNLSSIPTDPCGKSASFGTKTTVTSSATSGDLQCLSPTATAAARALFADARKLETLTQ